MKLRKSLKVLMNLIPIAAIALLGFIAYQKYQGAQATARPDYDNPNSEYKPKLSGEPPRTTPHQVKRVSDGDTIVLENGDKVRFCGIDAPEKDQPLGAESKANLQQLINSAGGSVLIQESDRDRYGRIVAEVFVKMPNSPEEKLLNYEQIRAGLAYEYKQYSGNCPNKESFSDAEVRAKAEKKGVWNGGNYTKPWDFRKAQRAN